MKKLTVAGCLMWIIGLAAFITGMNLTGAAKEWTTTGGSITFLTGLGVMGFIWVKKKKDEEK